MSRCLTVPVSVAGDLRVGVCTCWLVLRCFASRSLSIPAG